MFDSKGERQSYRPIANDRERERHLGYWIRREEKTWGSLRCHKGGQEGLVIQEKRENDYNVIH